MREAVVFIHGIYMVGLEMAWLRHRLRQAGYDCHQFHYHSLLRPPRENAAILQRYLQAIDADRIHLVAHSLGGIVATHLFDSHPVQKPGRVVMLGTPLKGSVVAERMNELPWLRVFLGRALEQGLLGDAPPWHGDRELGMVAGMRGVGLGQLIFLGRMPGLHDGTVAVDETEVPWVTDRLQVPYSHFGMLFHKDVAEAIANFLRMGRFNPHIS